MSRDDIIHMAREECPYTSDEMRGAFYEGFLKGAAAEREACAKACAASDLIAWPTVAEIEAINQCAAAIRARSTNEL